MKLPVKLITLSLFLLKTGLAIECANNQALVKGTTRTLYNTSLSLVAAKSDITSCTNNDQQDSTKCVRLAKGLGFFEVIYSEYDAINPNFKKLIKDIPYQANYKREYSYELCASWVSQEGEIIVAPEYGGNIELNNIALQSN